MNDYTFEITSIHKVSKFSYFFRYNEVVLEYKVSSKKQNLVYAINKETCFQILNKQVTCGILLMVSPGITSSLLDFSLLIEPPIKFIELMIRNIEKYEKLQEYR